MASRSHCEYAKVTSLVLGYIKISSLISTILMHLLREHRLCVVSISLFSVALLKTFPNEFCRKALLYATTCDVNGDFYSNWISCLKPLFSYTILYSYAVEGSDLVSELVTCSTPILSFPRPIPVHFRLNLFKLGRTLAALPRYCLLSHTKVLDYPKYTINLTINRIKNTFLSGPVSLETSMDIS